MEFWNFYMCKPYIDENLDAWILVHNLCKDIWKTGERTDGQTYATTIPLCQNWPGVIKTQMAFHNYQSGLLFMCIDANVFIIDSWHNCNHYFRQLRRSAWVSFLNYLFTMAPGSSCLQGRVLRIPLLRFEAEIIGWHQNMPISRSLMCLQ